MQKYCVGVEYKLFRAGTNYILFMSNIPFAYLPFDNIKHLLAPLIKKLRPALFSQSAYLYRVSYTPTINKTQGFSTKNIYQMKKCGFTVPRTMIMEVKTQTFIFTVSQYHLHTRQ